VSLLPDWEPITACRVGFTIVAVDSSLLGPGMFSITLSSGYSKSGQLLDGSITIY